MNGSVLIWGTFSNPLNQVSESQVVDEPNITVIVPFASEKKGEEFNFSLGYKEETTINVKATPPMNIITRRNKKKTISSSVWIIMVVTVQDTAKHIAPFIGWVVQWRIMEEIIRVV